MHYGASPSVSKKSHSAKISKKLDNEKAWDIHVLNTFLFDDLENAGLE